HACLRNRAASIDGVNFPLQTRGASMFKNLFSIEAKTALGTGGSRGIGEMSAAGFVANGAKVYISSRKAAACEATAKRLSETLGGTCIALPGDLSLLSGVEAVAKELAAR